VGPKIPEGKGWGNNTGGGLSKKHPVGGKKLFKKKVWISCRVWWDFLFFFFVFAVLVLGGGRGGGPTHPNPKTQRARPHAFALPKEHHTGLRLFQLSWTLSKKHNKKTFKGTRKRVTDSLGGPGGSQGVLGGCIFGIRDGARGGFWGKRVLFCVRKARGSQKGPIFSSGIGAGAGGGIFVSVIWPLGGGGDPSKGGKPLPCCASSTYRQLGALC